MVGRGKAQGQCPTVASGFCPMRCRSQTAAPVPAARARPPILPQTGRPPAKRPTTGQSGLPTHPATVIMKYALNFMR